MANATYWYKDAILYEVHVRAFSDSNGDGVGDFPGLTSKLGYLQDLGVTALWLLPFYPSPLKDDGYDIAEYTAVNPTYGTLKEFDAFLHEAHRRSLKVITELVLNHTSDQHAWFQRARRSPAGSPERDFYVWSDSPERYPEARIIFKDFEHSNWAWDPVAKAYYWHRFYSHQPDLNFDSPAVRRSMIEVLDFWLERGVDGLRLDAVPYLFERDGTHCENLQPTHAYLKELRALVDRKYGDRMLLAEANQWPEDAAAYFGAGKGDECHTAFHFPLMPRMFMAVQNEDRFPIVDILDQTPELPEAGQWVLFLRNHDELTLEMVTDEERDSMYRFYAADPQARVNLGIRRRLAPLLGNDRRKLELLNGLLFSLPGTPVIYYGEEIGMGDNVYLGDRNSVRTPMPWSSDRNAGFSAANPQRLYLPVIIDPEYHYEAVNVDVQQTNPQSLLWWTKRILALRRRFAQVFGRGRLEMLQPENRRVVAFLRRHEEQDVLVVANLSRFAQHVELELPGLRGRVPVELFGRNEFPAVGEGRYPVTLGPHGFYWFLLRPASARDHAGGSTRAALEAKAGWEELFGSSRGAATAEVLLEYLNSRGTLGAKGGQALSARIVEAVPFGERAYWVLLEVEYDLPEQPRETFSLPLALVSGEAAAALERDQPGAVVARLEVPGGAALLADGAAEPGFRRSVLEAIAGERRFAGPSRELVGSPFGPLSDGRAGDAATESTVEWSPHSTSLLYRDRFDVRLARRLEAGPHPDVELGRLLTERGFPHLKPFAGHLESRAKQGSATVLAVSHAHRAAVGGCWRHAVDSVGRYFVAALARSPSASPPPFALPRESLAKLSTSELPGEAKELIGPFLQDAELLGRRIGELHLALADATRGTAMAPEPFTALYQRELYQGLRTQARQVAALLGRALALLPEDARTEGRRVVELESEALRRFRSALQAKLGAVRLRCHGDLHLGSVLYTGKDFVMLGLSGDEAPSLSRQRIKRSPVRDAAAMLRSFHYAATSALFGREPGLEVRPQDRGVLLPWAQYWKVWVAAAFLKGYRESGAQAAFAPKEEEFALLLSLFLRERAFRELGHELRLRPDWAPVALHGLAALLETA